MKNLRYCSNSWFIHSICLSVCRWNTINNLVSISSILFSSLVNSTMNYSPLSNIILSGNLCNFYTLSLNNLANPSADVPSVIATKCVIIDNLSQTTRIAFFPATNSNFVMKSTIRYIHSTLCTLLNFNSPTSISVLFFMH